MGYENYNGYQAHHGTKYPSNDGRSIRLHSNEDIQGMAMPSVDTSFYARTAKPVFSWALLDKIQTDVVE